MMLSFQFSLLRVHQNWQWYSWALTIMPEVCYLVKITPRKGCFYAGFCVRKRLMTWEAGSRHSSRRQGNGALSESAQFGAKRGACLGPCVLKSERGCSFITSQDMRKKSVSAPVCSPLKCLCCSQAFKLVYHWLTETSIGLTFSRADFWSCAVSWHGNNWPNFSEVTKIPLTSSLHPETFKKITPGAHIWKS